MMHHTARRHLKRVTVVLPLALHRALKFRSIEKDISMNDQVVAAVQQYLSNCGDEKSEPKLDS